MITEGEKDRQILHKLLLQYIKVPTVRDINQGYGICLTSELFWLWLNTNSPNQAKMLISSQGIDWYIYFGLGTKHLKNKRTLKIPVFLHCLVHILTASHDVHDNMIPHLTVALKPIQYSSQVVSYSSHHHLNQFEDIFSSSK